MIALVAALVAVPSTPVGAQRAAGDPTGERGIDAARGGGMVIACRHAITDSEGENEMTLRYDDPSQQRRLSAEGERQARALGEAFRALEIPVGEIIASPMDRARRTAELMFGRAQLDSAWHTRGDNYEGFKRERRLDLLSGQPEDGLNRVVVSHIGTMYSVLPSIRGQLDEGDCVVVRPRGERSYDVLGVVPWRAWLRAARREDVR